MSDSEAAQPLIQPAESDYNENNSAKNCLFSWLTIFFPSSASTSVPTETAPTKSLDDFLCPTFDQVNLEEYLKENNYNPIFESSNLTIYYQDLHVGNGRAVMMENDKDFNLQKVSFDYDYYNRSAKRVKSNESGSNRSPKTCHFCNRRCSGLEIGIQGMREGGIRRIVIYPPQHRSTGYEIFHFKLHEVSMSDGCIIRNIFQDQSSESYF